MIRLITDLPALANDIGEIIRLFFDAEISLDEGELTIHHEHAEHGGRWVECFSMGEMVRIHEADAVGAPGSLTYKKHLKRAVKTACFLLLRAVTQSTPPWGSLTGIRPTRMFYELLGEGLSGNQAADRLSRDFFVSSEKTQLLAEIVEAQRPLIDARDDEFDLYIGIPFCRTRCAYCSFVSGEIGDGRLIEAYVEALIAEMRGCARLMDTLDLNLRAGYVGGGTPTAISVHLLVRIIDEVQSLFPGAREWTVEAGRPDSMNDEVLHRLKPFASRISVNPQTFSDDTLRRIGRDHTAEDSVAAFGRARDAGYNNINMDLIAALPGELLPDFESSIERVLALNPENITIHTLAIKRASRLRTEQYQQADAQTAAVMVELARSRLSDAGYRPYYLYRQKYMAGNLENTGYAKPGIECLYNIDHMEETTRILAVGAGAITKWLFPRQRRIERAPNVRDVEQYIARVGEMVERKRALIEG